MNWSKAKNILIFLFLFTDIFLLANFIAGRKLAEIPENIITSTVSILSENNIQINPDIIPRRTPSAPYSEAENIISDYSAFAEKFLGENFTALENGNFKSDAGTLSIIGDSFVFTSGSENTPNSFERFTEKNLIDAASRFLSEKGFADISSAKCETLKTDHGMEVTFAGFINSLPFFNSKVTVEFFGGTVTSVRGTWFNELSSRGQASELKSATSALIEFIPKYLASALEIQSITLGYNIPESASYHKSAVLVPTWCITESNGTKHLLDARTPE